MHRSGIIGDTVQSLGFLSRLPIPRNWLDGESSALKASLRAFPLAGAILGLLAGLALLIADFLHLPVLACSFIAVGVLIAMTGALHEDGLGDTADGFFGAATAGQRLEIMKDSRIGTFAALALVIVTALKATLLATIMQRTGAGYAVMALVGVEAASRTAMLVLWYALPSARPGGLADNLGAPQWETLVCALAIGFGILAITIVPAGGWTALLKALIFTAALLYGFAKLCMAKIGGQTGDTLGATQQLCALAVLIGLVSAL
ncbi:adenosylcobinamide-GDP ribazoletransferase [Falsochrobactrum shanghaiense]|uniref:Adenosylcobinamide-GDP ribazoletransferase n=1 Tax=Falsochrobactrum shanghaiense TaxID=2201899 RepID=A0A316J968_9HYPH|nr:adenosylcobinamide-GDP ribazoletransferase [Falsochrobactrum shanghaiense]PWL18024.1 adenosylcobinamide-GDP ribazoletransferase [Falsochrobactrum shanghaiense]